jgi:hypothetical protein
MKMEIIRRPRSDESDNSFSVHLKNATLLSGEPKVVRKVIDGFINTLANGLFAAIDIEKGDIVLAVSGRVMPKDLREVNYEQNDFFEFSKNTVLRKWDIHRDAIKMGKEHVCPYNFMVRRPLFAFSAEKSNLAVHSKFVTHDLDFGDIVYSAARHISAGEELISPFEQDYADYGMDPVSQPVVFASLETRFIERFVLSVLVVTLLILFM